MIGKVLYKEELNTSFIKTTLYQIDSIDAEESSIEIGNIGYENHESIDYASEYLLNLAFVGDYINGKKITEIVVNEDGWKEVKFNDSRYSEIINEDEVESFITKEWFEKNIYKRKKIWSGSEMRWEHEQSK